MSNEGIGTVKQNEIPAAIDCLHDDIAVLGEAVSSIATRLDSILSPNKPQDAATQPEKPAPISTLASNIRGASYKVQSVCAVIKNLLQRCEI